MFTYRALPSRRDASIFSFLLQRTEIIPVLIEEVDKMPRSFTFVPIISGVEKFNNVANKVCQSIDAYFQFKKKLEVFSPAEVGYPFSLFHVVSVPQS